MNRFENDFAWAPIGTITDDGLPSNIMYRYYFYILYI